MRLQIAVLLLCLLARQAFAQDTRQTVLPAELEIAISPSFPVGMVIVYAGLIDEKLAEKLDDQGWVPLDGRTLPRNGKYSKLVGVLKDQFKLPGDNLANTFRLPNLVGRVPVGASTVVTASPRGMLPLAATGGIEKLSLSAADLPHQHHVDGKTTGQTEYWCCISTRSLPNTDGFDHDHSFSVDSQGVKNASTFTMDNMQPFLVLHFLIRYK
jgi:microcystin-dependent protein